MQKDSSRTSGLFAERPALQVIGAAGLLFAVVFACRIVDDAPQSGVHLFYIIPVILLALRFGVRGGLIGAAVALLLFVLWSLVGPHEIALETWISPAFTVLLVGWFVGYLAQSLMRSERRFRVAAENQLEPFALYTAVRDERGKIIDFRNEFINDIGAESVGLPRERMVGRLLSELFPGRLEHGMFDEYVSVVESGVPVFREATDHLNVLGEQTLVRAFDMRVSKLDDGVEVTWRDITDRVRAERERDWLASIVENATDAVLSVDCDLRVVSWSESAERLYGYTFDEVIGRDVSSLVSSGEAAKHTAYLERVLDGERLATVHAAELHRDGSEIPVSFVAWPIVDRDGEVIGAAKIVRELAR